MIRKKIEKIDINRVNFEITHLFTFDFLLENCAFPLSEDSESITFIIKDLNDETIKGALRKKFIGRDVIFYESSKEEIEKAILTYKGKRERNFKLEITEGFNSLKRFQAQSVTPIVQKEKKQSLEETLNKPGIPAIVNGVNAIIINAVNLGASDIHIEPYETEVRLRYRIDGLLINIRTFPISLMPAISSRIKILANLNISETRRSQDGRFRMHIQGKDVDFRFSTILLAAGEKIVLRILDKSANTMALPQLGFDKDSLEKINKAINSPYGLILVTGPTGSGKSTTLYSILNQLNSPEVNISTIEDPVEYNVTGINQVQANDEIGNDFSTVLKSFLRQDPDVIMIGEIRDTETASIAIKSSLTGHLVLSTLHTNNAVATINRILDMGIDSSLMVSAMSLIITQRLIRKSCPKCSEIDHLKNEKLLLLGEDIKKYENQDFYISKGCEACNDIGYKGRSVIFEVLTPTRELKEAILNGVSQDALIDIARKNGMSTLKEVAIEKAREKVTSLDEVIRLL